MKMNNRGNWSLIGLLAAVAIVMVLGAVYFKGGFSTVKSNSTLVDKSSKKQTVFGKSIDTGKGVDCRERLNQIRTAVQQSKAVSGSEENPASLKDLQMGVGPDYFNCPVSNQPYVYDPATGTVHCPYPAHSQF